MNKEDLIIEGFDFTRFPITKIYKLGDKTVIQVEESHKKELLCQIEKLEQTVEDQFDDFFEALRDCFPDFYANSLLSIRDNIYDLEKFVNEKYYSD